MATFIVNNTIPARMKGCGVVKKVTLFKTTYHIAMTEAGYHIAPNTKVNIRYVTQNSVLVVKRKKSKTPKLYLPKL